MAYCSNDFDSALSDDWDVIVMDTDGSEKQQLTEDPARDYPYAWSPDSSEIAFTSERDGANRVWVMDADGSKQQRLTHLDSDFETVVAWFRDGAHLLVSIESSADGLRGWYLADRSGELLGRIDVLPAEVCCRRGAGGVLGAIASVKTKGGIHLRPVGVPGITLSGPAVGEDPFVGARQPAHLLEERLTGRSTFSPRLSASRRGAGDRNSTQGWTTARVVPRF
jgi:hypothetical protein